jgi:phage repressor protein C with HTH and peptisase S24 domain
MKSVKDGLEIRDRLETLLKTLGLKPLEFAQKTGVPKSTVYNILNGASTPSTATLNLISKTFNINPEWLKTGKGEMFLKNEEEDIFNHPSIEQIIYFPVVAKVGAGFPQDNNQIEVIEYIPLPASMNLDKNKHFIVKVHGDSMEPTLQDGDYVISKYYFNDTTDIPNKKIVIVRDDNGELYVKRLLKGKNGIVFISDNPDYEPIYPNEGYRIVGVAQEVIARRKL